MQHLDPATTGPIALAWLLVLPTIALAQNETPTADRTRAREVIAGFHQDLVDRGGQDADLVVLLPGLDYPHPLVLEELLRWASRPPAAPARTDRSRRAGPRFEAQRPNHQAAHVIARTFAGDPRAARGLLRLIDACARQRPRPGTLAAIQRTDDLVAFLEAYGEIGYGEGAHRLLVLCEKEDVEVCLAVLEAVGEVGGAPEIEPLVRVLAHGERLPGDRREPLIEGARAALETITGARLDAGTSRDWAAWWRTHRRTFARR